MSLQRGFPPKLGNPPENRDFRPISSRNMHSDNQTQCNDTCFVQNFDLKPLPTPFPTTLPTPSLPHPHTPIPTQRAIYVLDSVFMKIIHPPVPTPPAPTPASAPHTNIPIIFAYTNVIYCSFSLNQASSVQWS